jgi:hypothetical protein
VLGEDYSATRTAFQAVIGKIMRDNSST